MFYYVPPCPSPHIYEWGAASRSILCTNVVGAGRIAKAQLSLPPSSTKFKSIMAAERHKSSLDDKHEDAAAAHLPVSAMRHGKAELEALQIAQAGGWEVDALITTMEEQLEAAGGQKSGLFTIDFKDPRHFTWLLVGFASMGGLLSGLDQSLISGANLYLPKDLGLTTRQNSLVNSAMPLGAVGGAILLSPVNEYLGRKRAILIAIVLYTIGAALEAGSISFGKPSADDGTLRRTDLRG